MITRSDYIGGKVEDDSAGQGFKNIPTPAEENTQASTTSSISAPTPTPKPKVLSMQNIAALGIASYLIWYFFIRKD